MSHSLKYQEAPLLLLSLFRRFFFRPISVFWLTEESCRPPGYAHRHFILSSPLSPSAHPLPSATVSVILCEAPVILDTDAGLNVHAKQGPSTRSWIPTFMAEGRISFSKCLAGKYVTGLETDPVKNRWDVFKPATGACVIRFFPHTRLKVKSVDPLPAEVLFVKSKQPWSSLSEICR